MKKRCSMSVLRVISVLALVFFLPLASYSADHGDAPIASNNASSDIADVYAFLDPNDNSKLTLIMTQRGFITPGENVNFGIFDQFLRYRFELEMTGDAEPDQFINITFSPIKDSSGGPQTATIELPGRQVFTAMTTRSSNGPVAPTQVITTDSTTGVRFFAGLVDDPFFFDIPAFNRFVASVRAGTPDPTQLQRGRDSFAGFNLMGIALSIPLSLLNSPNSIGVSGAIQRLVTTRDRTGVFKSQKFEQVERMGNPAVNVALIPFSRKDEHNVSNQVDDANGLFRDDIDATLKALGTNAAFRDIFIKLLVPTGDYLRLSTRIANTGPRGGTNPAAAFPNGRRLTDDIVDIELTLIANGTKLGDSVDASDVPPADTFPFLALSQQPRNTGVIDDNTRN